MSENEINIPLILELGGNVKGELAQAEAKVETAAFFSRSLFRLIQTAAAEVEGQPHKVSEFLEDVQNVCCIGIALEISTQSSFMPISQAIEKLEKSGVKTYAGK